MDSARGGQRTASVYSRGWGDASVLLSVAVVGIIATALSLASEIFEVLYMVCWIACFFLLSVQNRGSIRLTRYLGAYAAVLLLLLVVCFVGFIATGSSVYITGFFVVIAKPFIIYAIGSFLFWETKRLSVSSTHAFPRVLLAAYVLGASTLAIWMLANYFPGFSAWLSNQMYIFEGKNAAGQIIGVAAIVCFVACFKGSGKVRVLLGALSAMLTLTVLVMQCRTACVACLLSYAFLLLVTRNIKILACLIVAALIIFVVLPQAGDIVVHGFFLDLYAGADANTLSSGRLGFWDAAVSEFLGSPIIGTGDYYTDNFYINALANVGIAGAIPIFGLWGARIVLNVKYGYKTFSGNKDALTNRILLALSIFYFIESILEGYPPFGPGSCSFMFWLLCGFADAARSNLKAKGA